MFLAVPSRGLGEVIETLGAAGLGERTAIVSVAKGLVPPDGTAADDVLRADASAPTGSPASAAPRTPRRWCMPARGSSRRRADEELARALAQVFTRAGVVCELSNDPIGVELAGAAKNAAALAAGATEAQGLNAAGAAAGHIFAEVWRYAEGLGARPESMIGLAGAGDLVATALARESRNRRAGELLAAGVPAAEIPARIGQAVEALESVPLLAARARAGRGRRPRHQRPRAPDRRRAAAGRLGGAGARDRAAARAAGAGGPSRASGGAYGGGSPALSDADRPRRLPLLATEKSPALR